MSLMILLVRLVKRFIGCQESGSYEYFRKVINSDWIMITNDVNIQCEETLTSENVHLTVKWSLINILVRKCDLLNSSISNQNIEINIKYVKLK